MYRFNIKVDPDIVSDLCLNENTVIEAFFDDGNIIVRILDEEEAQEFPETECEVCPFFCHVRCTCVIRSKLLRPAKTYIPQMKKKEETNPLEDFLFGKVDLDGK
jgi:hypothetical protein